MKRKEKEAARLRQQNAKISKRLSSVAAHIDDDIMDEEEGFARAEMAAASKARRSAAAAKLAAENAEIRKELSEVTAEVDDDIGDEAAGAARGKALSSFGRSR